MLKVLVIQERMSWEEEMGPEHGDLWWALWLVWNVNLWLVSNVNLWNSNLIPRETKPLSCRPLWLTFHSPLAEKSRGGQLLPAKRSQVDLVETKKKNKREKVFLPSDDQLAWDTQSVASNVQQGVDLALISFEATDVFQTLRDAGSFMRVQYDSRSLCQLARLLRENHEKIPVRYW